MDATHSARLREHDPGAPALNGRAPDGAVSAADAVAALFGDEAGAFDRVHRGLAQRRRVAEILLMRVDRAAFALPALLARRQPPRFVLASRPMTIDGLTVPHDRFEEVNESTL